jgi:hypothetical protein
LVDSRLSPEQQTDIRNYAIGQYIDPLQSYAKARRHEFCKIVGKTETHLILQNPRGVEFELLPDRWDKRVYNADNINIAVNDEIRFKGLGSNGTVNALKRSQFTSDNNLKCCK